LPANFIPTRDQLYIPLTVAAAIVYRAFLDPGERAPRTEAELELRIDESARAVSIAVKVYRLDFDTPLEIPTATLAAGIFANGGRVLRFRDERAPIESLAVNRAELDAALAKRAHIVPESRPETIIPSKFSRPKLS
jgi:hypothetical protein